MTTPQQLAQQVRESLEIIVGGLRLYKSTPSVLHLKAPEYIEIAEEALAAADKLVEMVGWKPIESAPKTGESILLVAPAGKSGIFGMQTAYGHWYKIKGEFVYDGYSFANPSAPPTHWMRLPLPPI